MQGKARQALASGLAPIADSPWRRPKAERHASATRLRFAGWKYAAKPNWQSMVIRYGTTTSLPLSSGLPSTMTGESAGGGIEAYGDPQHLIIKAQGKASSLAGEERCPFWVSFSGAGWDPVLHSPSH